MKFIRHSFLVVLGIDCAAACASFTPVNAGSSQPVLKEASAATVAFTEIIHKVYDGQAVTDPSVSKTGDGALTYTYYSGDSVSETPLSSAPVHAGTYTVVASMAATNHYAAASASQTFTITPRPILLGLSETISGNTATITADVMNAVNNNGKVDFKITASGKPSAETDLGSQTITKNSENDWYTSSTTAQLTPASGETYTVNAVYLPDDSEKNDYTSSYDHPFSFTNKQTRTITVENRNINAVYGTTSPVSNPSSTEGTTNHDAYAYSVVLDEYPSLAATLSIDTAGTCTITNAGTAYIKETLTDTMNNYNDASVYWRVVVAPKPLTVTSHAVKNGAEITSASYGDLNNITYSLTCNQNIDLSTFTGEWGTLSAQPIPTASNGGTYSIGILRNGSSHENQFLSRNYKITYEEQTFTVNPKSLTITAGSVNDAVWGTVPAYSASLSGLLATDTIADMFTSTPTAAVDTSKTNGRTYEQLPAGTYSGVLAPVYTLNDYGAKDYTVTPVNGNLTISKASTALTISDVSKTYDGKAVEPPLTYDTRLTDVSPVLVYYKENETEPLAQAPSEPGTYQVKASMTGSSCFNDVSANRTFTIRKLDLIYSIDDLSKIYDGTAVTPVITSNTEETCTYTVTYLNEDTGKELSAAPADAGNYSVTITSDGNAHYNAVKYTKKFTITKKAVQPQTPAIPETQIKSGMTVAQIALPAGWSWEEPDTVLHPGKTTVNATYTPEDTVNYTTYTTPLTFTVLPEAVPASTPAPKQEDTSSIDTTADQVQSEPTSQNQEHYVSPKTSTGMEIPLAAAGFLLGCTAMFWMIHIKHHISA